MTMEQKEFDAQKAHGVPRAKTAAQTHDDAGTEKAKSGGWFCRHEGWQ